MTRMNTCPAVGLVQALITLLLLSWGSMAWAQGLPRPDGKPVLRIEGNIDCTNDQGAAVFDMAMLKAMPGTRIHTTTSVTDGVHHFDGVLMRELLRQACTSGDTIVAHALNHYMAEIDTADFTNYDVIAAYAMDGKQLTVSDKGPLWIVYPRSQHPELQDVRYDYLWVWQLNRIVVK